MVARQSKKFKNGTSLQFEIQLQPISHPLHHPHKHPVAYSAGSDHRNIVLRFLLDSLRNMVTA